MNRVRLVYFRYPQVVILSVEETYQVGKLVGSYYTQKGAQQG